MHIVTAASSGTSTIRDLFASKCGEMQDPQSKHNASIGSLVRRSQGEITEPQFCALFVATVCGTDYGLTDKRVLLDQLCFDMPRDRPSIATLQVHLSSHLASVGTLSRPGTRRRYQSLRSFHRSWDLKVLHQIFSGSSPTLRYNPSTFLPLISGLTSIGPIVRVWPNQLHINDIDVYNQIFSYSSKFEKYPPFYANPPMQGSLLTDVTRETAIPHRNMFAPSFKREAIRRAEPRVAQCVVKFLDKLDLKKGPINLTNALMCLMADSVMTFAYQQNFGALDTEDFQINLVIPIVDTAETLQWLIYFPSFSAAIFKLPEVLPDWALQRWFKTVTNQSKCLQTCYERIVFLAQNVDRPSTIFDTTLNLNLEKG
ncbi:MAG: hypothetical protein L6R40_006373 [Gallowayella cf. fulva]|nr:MAG: hypothetical protein L6R40_006373 [Xanthomendoza cf. fulva]